MEPAPELTAITHQIYDALSHGDTTLVDQLTSQQPGLVIIGTDPDEWWEERTALRDAVAAQAGAGITVVPGELRAYREGSVGWVADRGAFRLPDGTEVPVRLTAVFHQEDGQWRVVQAHASIGMSNQEAIGIDL